MRLALLLSGYTYKIIYTKQVPVEDCLSRLPTDESSGDDVISQQYVLGVNTKSLVIKSIPDELKQDAVLQNIYKWTYEGWPKTLPKSLQSKEYQKYYAKRFLITIDNGCLFKDQQLIVPPAFRKESEAVHKLHMGISKPKASLRQYYWWPNMDAEIDTLINNCGICAENQRGRHHKYYETWSKEDTPFKRIHIDFFDFAGKKFLLMIDSLSRWLQVEQVHSTKASKTIIKLNNMFNFIGLPEVIVLDNRPPFTSIEFIDWCRRNNIQVVRTPPYHPQSNGLAKRAVREVKHMMKKQINSYQQINWKETIKEIQRDIRFAGSETLQGRSPAQIVYNFDPRTSVNSWYKQVRRTEQQSWKKDKNEVMRDLPNGVWIYVRNIPNKWS